MGEVEGRWVKSKPDGWVGGRRAVEAKGGWSRGKVGGVEEEGGWSKGRVSEVEGRWWDRGRWVGSKG